MPRRGDGGAGRVERGVPSREEVLRVTRD